ncbi:MAG: hypothetical protein ACTHK5_00760 [Tsuneonella sp.]
METICIQASIDDDFAANKTARIGVKLLRRADGKMWLAFAIRAGSKPAAHSTAEAEPPPQAHQFAVKFVVSIHHLPHTQYAWFLDWQGSASTRRKDGESDEASHKPATNAL